jgi:hypothetical protein
MALAMPPRLLFLTPSILMRCAMLHAFSLYLAVIGGVTAGTQVARGAVRGVGRLAQGNPRGAAAEVIGGLVAPVVSAVRQFEQLGVDVCVSVAALTAGRPERADGPGAPCPSAGDRRPWAAAVAGNGAA